MLRTSGCSVFRLKWDILYLSPSRLREHHERVGRKNVRARDAVFWDGLRLYCPLIQHSGYLQDGADQLSSMGKDMIFKSPPLSEKL